MFEALSQTVGLLNECLWFSTKFIHFSRTSANSTIAYRSDNTRPRAEAQLEPIEDYLHDIGKSLDNWSIQAQFVTPWLVICWSKMDQKGGKETRSWHTSVHQHTRHPVLITQLWCIKVHPPSSSLLVVGTPTLWTCWRKCTLLPLYLVSSSFHVALGTVEHAFLCVILFIFYSHAQREPSSHCSQLEWMAGLVVGPSLGLSFLSSSLFLRKV